MAQRGMAEFAMMTSGARRVVVTGGILKEDIKDKYDLSYKTEPLKYPVLTTALACLLAKYYEDYLKEKHEEEKLVIPLDWMANTIHGNPPKGRAATRQELADLNELLIDGRKNLAITGTINGKKYKRQMPIIDWESLEEENIYKTNRNTTKGVVWIKSYPHICESAHAIKQLTKIESPKAYGYTKNLSLARMELWIFLRQEIYRMRGKKQANTILFDTLTRNCKARDYGQTRARKKLIEEELPPLLDCLAKKGDIVNHEWRTTQGKATKEKIVGITIKLAPKASQEALT